MSSRLNGTLVIQKYSFAIMTTKEHVCMLLRKQKNFKEIY